MSSLSIAIVGAGIAGLAAASFLADAGHRPVLFERFEEAKPLGAGLLIQPTGLAVIERLGLREEATRLGSRIERLYGRCGPDGPLIFDRRYDELLPGLHGTAMHRASLFHLLMGAALARGIALEQAADIAGVEDLTGRPILLDGMGRRLGPFDLVVDASGARSRLREAAGPVHIRPYAHGAVWGVARDTGFLRDALQQRYRTARFMIGVLPVGRLPDDPAPLDAFFWSLPVENLERWNQTDLGAWREEVAAIWPETLALTAQFTRNDQLTQARYAQLTVAEPVRGRLALIGDAWHQTSPQLGQGANMALLDAAALADAIALHSNLGEALAAFVAGRRAHIRFYQMASTVLTQFFQSHSRLTGPLRNATFGPMGRLPWLKTEMVKTLAGLKTGPFSWKKAEELAGLKGRMPRPIRGLAEEQP
ncbi:glutamate synthase [Labrys miyagiensis]|uniref:Glutamate synthase n=1 Tax=Labrys miyagiensis TaxID=346912 RepID=A0ABQ6CMD7_9HYPH|nr:NAD(P)/FAD-dependent oxidoreductase [Labrys miyagiensis]GLS21324.1 glutamate synthase [Labrys miyagiensis]